MIRFWDIEGVLKLKQVPHIGKGVQSIPFELKRGRIHQRFKNGSHLPFGIHGTVKKTVKKPAHHRLYHAFSKHNDSTIQFWDFRKHESHLAVPLRAFHDLNRY